MQDIAQQNLHGMNIKYCSSSIDRCHKKMTMINFSNKYALVTGGSSGIGAAIAKQLSKEGCNLFLTGLGSNDLEETKKA